MDQPFESISDLFKRYLVDRRLDEDFYNHRIKMLWGEILGEKISSRTGRIYFKGRVMFVKVSSAPLRHHLRTEKEEILSKINRKLGSRPHLLEDIKLV